MQGKKNGSTDTTTKQQEQAKATHGATSSTNPIQDKILQRLDKVIQEAPLTRHRSPDLIPLTQEYEEMRKRLRDLLVAIRKHAQNMALWHASRRELVQQLSIFTENSPLYDAIGRQSGKFQSSEVDGAAKESTDAIESIMKRVYLSSSAETNISLNCMEEFATAYGASSQRDFDQHVLQYAQIWEETVTSKIDQMLLNVRKLHKDRLHYELKVDELRKKSNAMEIKGLSSPPKQLVRLERNEEKLKAAFTAHEQESGRLCALIEATIHRGWIELYTVCRNYMKWESNRVARETDTYSPLADTMENMKVVYKRSSTNGQPKPSTTAMPGLSEQEGGSKKKNGKRASKIKD